MRNFACFIDYSYMQNDKGNIVEMSSAQGEKVEMEHPVEAKGTLVLQMARYSLY